MLPLMFEACPDSAPFFGFMGITAAVVFANLGAAYGTAKSGVGISSMGVMKPELVMRNIIPVVMAGVLGIYGLIVAVVLIQAVKPPYPPFNGFAHLAAGLACGLSSLAAGFAIGIVGDAGVRANGQQPKLFVGMILILIFGEALGLYGLIIALILSQSKDTTNKCTVTRLAKFAASRSAIKAIKSGWGRVVAAPSFEKHISRGISITLIKSPAVPDSRYTTST